MAYALVGTAGTVSQGASGATVSPAFGAGESRTAGNLLIAVVLGTNVANLPATPSGWSIAKQQAGTSCSATIFYKIAAGADAAPTFSAPSTIVSAGLSEFSGNRSSSSPLDQSGGAFGTTSPQTATPAAMDAQNGGELLIVASVAFYSAAATKTLSNSAPATTLGANGGTSTASHYACGFNTTTSNASATANAFTFTTTSITGAGTIIATFRSPGSVLPASRSARRHLLNR